MIALIACGILGCAYFIFKFVRIHQPQNANLYRHSMKFLNFYVILSIITVTITLIYGIINLRNFGKGLKERSKNFFNFSRIAKIWTLSAHAYIVINIKQTKILSFSCPGKNKKCD